jgi:hypothetical protein
MSTHCSVCARGRGPQTRAASRSRGPAQAVARPCKQNSRGRQRVVPPPKTCASGQHCDGYERREPEQTLLYQVIGCDWPSFRERAEFEGGLREFIIDEFEAWLLQRVFAVDVMNCPKCEGRMALKKIANTAEDIAVVLAQVVLGPRPPPRLQVRQRRRCARAPRRARQAVPQRGTAIRAGALAHHRALQGRPPRRRRGRRATLHCRAPEIDSSQAPARHLHRRSALNVECSLFDGLVASFVLGASLCEPVRSLSCRGSVLASELVLGRFHSSRGRVVDSTLMLR